MARRKSLEELNKLGHNPKVAEAVRLAGGTVKVAKEFGYKTAWSAGKWCYGHRVPAEHVRRLCEMGGNQIKPHEIRPDVFDGGAT